jgi:hypothetical protein
MSNAKKFIYTTGEDDQAYVCPLEAVNSDEPVTLEQLDDCVEADVVGRYSGNLTIVNR